MPRIDIRSWLQALGMSYYAQAFADHHIDEQALVLLTDADLKEIGISSLGHRKKLLHAIASLLARDAVQGGESAARDWDMGERRTVTVMFCDIASFTRMTADRDPEEIHGLLNRYFELVDGIVQAYGGHVDKHIGDAVMAVFGAPVAHTNDPERAVRAALDIHHAVGSLRPAIRVHTGIASGPVVASPTGSPTHREYTMIGHAVNLAARLQGQAASGEILASAAVQGAVAHLVESTPVDDMALEGIDAPGRFWRIQCLRAQAAVGARPAFVGRSREMGQLAEWLEACRAHGKGHVAHISGEAGIGKTRLVEELRAMAEARGFGHHTGLVLDFGDGGDQSAITDLVCSLLRIARSSSAAERAQAVRSARERCLIAPDQEAYLNDLLDLPQPGLLRARYNAMPHVVRSQGKREIVAELIVQCAAERPQLVIIEDVHWADEAVLAYLHHVARSIANRPVILLLTARREGDPLAVLANDPGVTMSTLSLVPLMPDESRTLAGQFSHLDGSVIRTCVQRAGGNPLYLEHLLHNAEDGALDSLPDSLQSLIQARIDHLDSRNKRALQAASVMGQRFTLAALRYLLDDPIYTCESLIEHHLVRRVGEEYLFAHALVMEGVYASLLRSWRRSLHRKAAAWFAAHNPALHAEQLERAEDVEAPRAYLAAARGQTNEYRFERALALVERGLALPGDHTTRHALICFRADLLRELGTTAESIAAFEHAEVLASDDIERCRAWIGQVQGLRIADRTEQALPMLARAQAVAAQHDMIEELATIHYLRGSLFFPRGDIEGCLDEHEKARGYARLASSPELEARALGGLGDAYYMRGQMVSAHAHYARCIELCRAHGIGSIEVANLAMRGNARLYQNDLHGALRDGSDAAVAAAQVGNKRAEIVARGAMGLVLVEMGRIEQARAELSRALEGARALGSRRFAIHCLTLLGKLLVMEGRGAEAREPIEESLRLSRETDFSFEGPMTLSVLALASDDPDEQRRALAEGEEWLRSDSLSHNYLQFYRDAMNVALRAGDADSVERYADALEAYTRGELLPWSQLYIQRGRALAAHMRGARDEGVLSALRQLHEQTQRVGLHPAALAIEQALGLPA